MNRLRNLIIEDAVDVLKAHTVKAVDTLVKLLEVENPALQRNVANDIIEHVIKFKELQDIEKRLEILEAK